MTGSNWETERETKWDSCRIKISHKSKHNGRQSGTQLELPQNHLATGSNWERMWETKRETKPESCRDKISHKSTHNWRHSGRQSKPGENQFVTGSKWETKVVNKVGRKVIRAKIIL